MPQKYFGVFYINYMTGRGLKDMIKRILVLIIITLFCFSFLGCTKDDKPKKSPNTNITIKSKKIQQSEQDDLNNSFSTEDEEENEGGNSYEEGDFEPPVPPTE